MIDGIWHLGYSIMVHVSIMGKFLIGMQPNLI